MKKKGRNIRGWFIHLGVFILAQLLFIWSYKSDWAIFNLNPGGEKAEQFLSKFTLWIDIHETQLLNLITLIWGIALIIDGLLVLYFTTRVKRKTS